MIRPLHDQVLVRRTKSEATYGKSNLIIPEANREKPITGVVEAVGPGRISTETGERLPMGVKVGETVVFGKFSGQDNEGRSRAIDDDQLVLREGDILAVDDDP